MLEQGEKKQKKKNIHVDNYLCKFMYLAIYPYNMGMFWKSGIQTNSSFAIT